MSKLRFFILALLLVSALGYLTSAHAQENPPDADTAENKVYLPAVRQDGADANQTTADQTTADLIVRLRYRSHDELETLLAELDVLEASCGASCVLALVSPATYQRLVDAGRQVEIDQAQTEQLAAGIAHFHAATAAGAQAVESIPGYACYRTVEETYNSLSTLAAANPQIATWIDIGDTWEKVTPGGAAGYDIYALKLTNSAIPGPKPVFMLMAAIHAREYTTAELATRFAEELITKYNTDPDVTWLLDYFEIHIVPQVNPDGRKKAETGLSWRKNTDNDDGCNLSSSWGTDLNRNSSFKWNMGGSSSNACNATYRGPSAGSEPETQVIQSYAASIFPDQRGPNDTDAAPATTEGVFITLHSYGQLVLYPWSYTSTPSPNLSQLATLGRKFGYFNGHEVCNGPVCLYNASGTTDDYTYGELGVASYTFEMGTVFFESCTNFTSSILPGNMPALYYAAKAARRPYQNPAGPDALNVAISPATVPQGDPVTLNATLDDTRYNSNGWGTESVQNIQAGQYTIDAPSWAGGVPVAMSASDGAFNATIENVTATIDTSGLSVGRHTVFVEGQDANGNWGVLSAVFLWVETNGPTPTPTDTPTPTNTPLPTDTPTITPTPTDTPTPTNTPTPTDTPTPTNTPVGGSVVLYVSSTTNGTAGGVSFADEDILAYNTGTGVWSMVYDGSDVSGGTDVNAFAFLSDGSILLSFDAALTLSGAGSVDDSDIVRFVPTSLGGTTAGAFELYFDGSDVGLSTNNEDIDALHVLSTGDLIISTLGSFSVAGASGNDEDLVRFTPTGLGSATSGSWSLYFDGSDVGLNEATSEQVYGVSIDEATGDIYLTTAGAFSVSGLSGDGADVFICTPSSLGSTTSCTFSQYWDGSAHGYAGEIIDGVDLVQGGAGRSGVLRHLTPADATDAAVNDPNAVDTADEVGD